MIGEIECVSPLNTKEVTVDPALVAIVAADDLHSGIGSPHAESGLTSIAAMRACGANVLHFPRPRFVAIGTRGQSANGADVDTHAALFALEVIFFVGNDGRDDAAIIDAQRPDVHAFAANAHAAVTQNAAR